MKYRFDPKTNLAIRSINFRVATESFLEHEAIFWLAPHVHGMVALLDDLA